ncbi:MAG: formylglycine-generating enzyme family protein [Pseudomonadota bacterium]
MSEGGDWQPPGGDHHPLEERKPWTRWVVSIGLLAVIAVGAIWLASRVVVPSDVPAVDAGDETLEAAEADPEPNEEEDGTLSDDEAWVRALEKDTLEGYREYLALCPNGRHAEDAQTEIDKYDEEAWQIALQRNTIAGFEDYLEAWPEGLHASEARERVEEMKARAEAIAEDAAERATQETADWEAAARENTIESYGRYLTKHPAGAHAEEAQRRIASIRNAAADAAAWREAIAANTVAAYEQYLASFPRGARVSDAIAAIEQLRPSPGRTFRDCDSCPLMVTLPTGNAALGAGDDDPDTRPNEKPQRPVTFSRLFAIGVHEITFDDYAACVSDGGCASLPGNNGWGAGSRPVINVSWDDAQAYIGWLSEKSGQTYALPSEAQWEYAARAGDGSVFAGGSPAALCAFANGASAESGFDWANGACSDPAADRTMPVGTLSANAFGLKDMIGNVGEWTLDCNTLNLRDAPTDGGADQRGSCNQRVVRGGSWFSGTADLRYAARLMQRRGDRNDFTGFRVIRRIDNS